MSALLPQPDPDPTALALSDWVGRILSAHCSGWRAVHLFAWAMPDSFVQPGIEPSSASEARGPAVRSRSREGPRTRPVR